MVAAPPVIVLTVLLYSLHDNNQVGILVQDGLGTADGCLTPVGHPIPGDIIPPAGRGFHPHSQKPAMGFVVYINGHHLGAVFVAVNHEQPVTDPLVLGKIIRIPQGFLHISVGLPGMVIQNNPHAQAPRLLYDLIQYFNRRKTAQIQVEAFFMGIRICSVGIYLN